MKAAAVNNGVPESSIVVCSEVVPSLPGTADIEDLFHVDDYLKLYNIALASNVVAADPPPTNEPILKRLESIRGKFDHALPAHALTEQRVEFFRTISSDTEERFRKLFVRLNATL